MPAYSLDQLNEQDLDDLLELSLGTLRGGTKYGAALQDLHEEPICVDSLWPRAVSSLVRSPPCPVPSRNRNRSRRSGSLAGHGDPSQWLMVGGDYTGRSGTVR